MAVKEKKERKEISCTIDEEFGDNILYEGNNISINARRVSWNGGVYKIDVRKYSFKDGEEIMGKGVSIPDEGCDELAKLLVDKGYGNTRDIIKSIRTRDDFDESLLDKEIPIDDSSEEEYYDPKELLSEDIG